MSEYRDGDNTDAHRQGDRPRDVEVCCASLIGIEFWGVGTYAPYQRPCAVIKHSLDLLLKPPAV